MLLLKIVVQIVCREGGIDRLIRIYKTMVYKTGGYLTDSGTVNLARTHMVLTELGEAEDEIFKKRRNDEVLTMYLQHCNFI